MGAPGKVFLDLLEPAWFSLADRRANLLFPPAQPHKEE